MSAGLDQWSVLGLRHDDKTAKKYSHGKGEDKGELSPWHVVQLGAASSTGFVRVLPPLSPCMGGAASGPVPAVGGIGAHMKLEPLAEFIGKTNRIHYKTPKPHYSGQMLMQH